MRSMASQLFRTIAPMVLAVLLGGGTVLYVLISDRLSNEFDTVLVTEARTLSALAEYENGMLELESYELALPAYVDPVDTEYFAMHDERGRLVIASPGVVDDSWLKVAGEPHHEQARFADITLPDGSDGRRFTLEFTPLIDASTDEEEADEENADDGPVPSPLGPIVYEAPVSSHGPLQLTVVVSRDPLDALVARVALLLAGVGAAVATAILLIGRRAIRQRLAPLAEIETRVATLDPTRPEQRLNLAPSSTEIDRLAAGFDRLLERVEAAMTRERRFSSDVAHELRTPIAELRTLAEVSLRFPDDTTLRADFLEEHLRSTERMERTVSTLLALARDDSGESLSGPNCDLGALLAECVTRFENEASRSRAAIRLALPERAVVTGGRHRWEHVLENLLGNALDYAVPGSNVEATLEVDGDLATLTIANLTDTLDDNDTLVMFDRFWRKDTARASAQHSGLGLALVRSCLESLGLDIEAQLGTAGPRGRRLSMIITAIPTVEYALPISSNAVV